MDNYLYCLQNIIFLILKLFGNNILIYFIYIFIIILISYFIANNKKMCKKLCAFFS